MTPPFHTLESACVKLREALDLAETVWQSAGGQARAFLVDAESLGCRCGQKLRKAQEEFRKQEGRTE